MIAFRFCITIAVELSVSLTNKASMSNLVSNRILEKTGNINIF